MALEQVVSFGTEGRRPEDEVLPSDNVYEYIVFRGSDVKDLRIEETPKENKPPKPQVPDDPAILGVSTLPANCLLLMRKRISGYMMKYFSDVNHIKSPRAQNHVETLRCLPSDVIRTAIDDYFLNTLDYG